MNTQLGIVVAILRKDLRIFWPLAAVTAALIAAERMDSLFLGLGPDLAAILSAFIQVAMPLAAVVLILSMVHEDAAVSVNHDWLTRPIAGGALLTAKGIFLICVVFGSSMIGQFAAEIVGGHGIAEAVLGSLVWITKGNTWMVLVGIFALASMTENLRQFMVLAVTAIVSMIVIWYLAASISGMINANGRSGIDWIVERTLVFWVIATGLGVLWLQYAKRDVRSAWTLLLASTASAAVLLSLASWQRGFAIQQSLAPNPEAAQEVSLEPATGCFAASRTDDRGGLFSVSNIGPEAMRVLAERVVRSDDIIFSTGLKLRALPPNGKVVIDRVVGAFGQPGRREIVPLQLARFTPKWIDNGGELSANHYWLLSRGTFERLAGMNDVELRLDYSITVLTQVANAELSANAGRNFYPGIGYCGATVAAPSSMAQIKCTKLGPQPALLFAKGVGASATAGRASDFPNYVPTAVDFLGGKAHWIQLEVPSVDTQIQVTAYEAQAHFDRQVVVPGVLGGPPSACPAP